MSTHQDRSQFHDLTTSQTSQTSLKHRKDVERHSGTNSAALEISWDFPRHVEMDNEGWNIYRSHRKMNTQDFCWLSSRTWFATSPPNLVVVSWRPKKTIRLEDPSVWLWHSVYHFYCIWFQETHFAVAVTCGVQVNLYNIYIYIYT